jgi:DNA-binding XRE family transcriptional regulator
MVSFGNTIPEFFKAYRSQSMMSQADLARLLKVTPQYICNVESGRHSRPIELCLVFMKFLDTRKQNHLDELIKEAQLRYHEKRIKKKASQKGAPKYSAQRA